MHHYQRAAARRTKNHSATPFSNCCCVRFSLASWTVFTFRTARVTPDSSPIPSRWLIHRRLTVVRCRSHQASTCLTGVSLNKSKFLPVSYVGIKIAIEAERSFPTTHLPGTPQTAIHHPNLGGGSAAGRSLGTIRQRVPDIGRAQQPRHPKLFLRR